MADTPVQGQQGATSAGSDFNAHAFLVQQILGRVNTATLVQIQAVSNNGGVSPVGTVDVMPLVNQIDGAGNQTPHGTIFGLPYFRLQGGTNAVILDPQVGDIGIAVFADHDVSSVKANKAQANPGSRRRFDMADGLYIGGVLNGTPVQYVQFNTNGISVVTPNNVVIQAQGNITATAGGNLQATVSGTTTVNSTGNATVTTSGNLSATANGSASITGTTGMTLNGPAGIVLNGNTTINGTLGTASGAHGSGNATINGTMTATGEVSAMGGAHTVSQHTHTQPSDSHGDSEQPTNTPTG